MSSSDYPALSDQKQFWNWHWQHWQERKTANEWSLKRNRRIMGLLRSLPLARPRILDLGCGPGWFTEELAHFGLATGVDLSQEAIAMAKSRVPQATFLAGNLFEISLPAKHFDVVVSQEVIDHVVDQVGYVQRAAHVLKPRGYLILTCANRFVIDRLGDQAFAGQPKGHIQKSLDIKSVRHLLKPHFRTLRETSLVPIGNGGILRLINSHKLNAVIGLVISAPYREALKERALLGYNLIVVAQKSS